MAPTEKAVQDRIMKGLRDRGAWVTKVHQTGYGRRGVPDLMCCYRGVFIAIEVKKPGGSVRDEQALELMAIRKAGGVGIVAERMSDVEMILMQIDGGMEISDLVQPPIAKPKVVHL